MNRLIPVLDEMLDTGLMAVSDVDVIRVQTGSQSDQTEPDGSYIRRRQKQERERSESIDEKIAI